VETDIVDAANAANELKKYKEGTNIYKPTPARSFGFPLSLNV
jgi:hypothetical protein